LSSVGYYASSIALKSDGTLWAWGSNMGGQLGDSSQNPTFEPKQIFGVSNPF